MGDAFGIYQQLSEEKKGDFDAIKNALLIAFTMDSFVAYMQLVKCCLHWGVTADIL